MAKYVIEDSTLTTIADAIRAKTGGSEKIAPGDMPNKIAGIETGINPSGTKEITENGTHDVTEFASVEVAVPGEVVEVYEAGDILEDLTGEWTFNQTITIPTKVYNVDFTCRGSSSNFYAFEPFDNGLMYNAPNGKTAAYWVSTNEWRTLGGSWQIIVISGGADLSNADFANWLKANAVKTPKELPTDEVIIGYNGNVIATLEGGESETIECANKKMLTDVTITVPNGMKIPKLQSKIAEITANGTVDVVADSGYDGLERVTIFTEVPAPVLPYYDGSVTISGGVELISFTIGAVQYEAEEGMTWGEWCDSSYNTGGWYITSENLITQNNASFIGSIYATDVIEADRIYSTTIGGSD